jgi:hypothetical protein
MPVARRSQQLALSQPALIVSHSPPIKSLLLLLLPSDVEGVILARYANAIMSTCQALLEGETTPPEALTPILQVMPLHHTAESLPCSKAPAILFISVQNVMQPPPTPPLPLHWCLHAPFTSCHPSCLKRNCLFAGAHRGCPPPALPPPPFCGPR